MLGAARSAGNHFIDLSQSHASLLELEVKSRLVTLGRVVCTIILACIVGGIAWVFASLALAGIINVYWPSIGNHGALGIVALGNALIMAMLFLSARASLQNGSFFRSESVRSLRESVMKTYRAF